MKKYLIILVIIMLTYILSGNDKFFVEDTPHIIQHSGLDKLEEESELILCNNSCSMLIVKTNIKDILFSANDYKVQLIEYKEKENEYWIVIDYDTYLLTISKKGYENIVLDFNSMGINLKPKEVWLMTLSDEVKLPLVPVTIITEPSDAIIRINNILYDNDRSPVYLPCKKHLLEVSKEPAYVTYKDSITVDSFHVVFRKYLEDNEKVKVTIISNPTDAKISINDSLEGFTNTEDIRLFPDIYRLKLEKKGFITKNEVIHVRKYSTNKFEYNLSEETGKLTINTDPPDANIKVDGCLLLSNQTTVSEGNHTIEVYKSRWYTKKVPVYIEIDQKITKDISLTPITGSLFITVIPESANSKLVDLNSNRVIRSFVGSEIINSLQIGKYKVVSKLDNYSTIEKFIEVKENVIDSVNITLPKLPLDTSKTLIKMSLVKGGEFLMGNDNSNDADEKPLHSVILNSFYIGQYEITQSQYNAIMTNTNLDTIEEKYPVRDVTWINAIIFCNKLSQREGLDECYYIAGDCALYDFSANGYRLPTEAEWEFAAKEGKNVNSNKFSGGNDLGKLGAFSGNSGNSIKNIGQYDPNQLNIYDMSGNVSEWCWDSYSKNYYKNSPINNPTGPESDDRNNRVIRGGNFMSQTYQCKITYRYFREADYSNSQIGFRIAKTAFE